MNDTQDAVESLVRGIGETNSLLHGIVQAARRLVRDVVPDVVESVKYGGIMFAAPTQFGGLFAYKGHVSLEFSRGCDLDDAHGALEGGGKFRRHITFQTVSDLESKHVRDYVAQAFANASA